MGLTNLLINYLKDFADKSETIYHVNPWIFGILFFGSAIPLYYGYYRIGRSVIKLEGRRITRKHINRKELRIGLAISIIAWWLPYVYVIMFGKLPINIWIFFIVFVVITGVFFIKTLKDKVKKAEADR